MMLPTTEGDRLVDLKEFKLKRTLIHLDMASPNTHKKNLICSTDNRDRRANVVSPDSSDAASAAATNNNNNNDGNNNDNSEDDNDSNNIGSTEINVRIRLNGRLKPNSSTAVLNNYELQNCRDAPTAKASAKYVANHHFQPEILQAIFPRLWAGHGRFKGIPIGWLISGDKGFDQTSVFYPHYNQILHPAFLTGGDKAQFSDKQIGWNRKACEKRYTSEVVFARFKKYGGMGQILERHSFHYVHYLWDGRMAWQILDISHCRHQQTRITFPNRSTAVNKYNI